MARSGEAKDIDYLMMILDSDRSIIAAKGIDYALTLVRSPDGIERLKHYLYEGSRQQRNYAALFFKRRKQDDVLQEAVRRGVIDRMQAFSK